MKEELIKKNLQVYLTSLPPNQVFNWLQSNDDDYIDDEIISALLERNDEQINLGLALYSTSDEVGKRLFKKDDTLLKKAVLSGRTLYDYLDTKNDWVSSSGILEELLSNYDEKLLSIYLQNNFIGSNALENLFQRTGLFEGILDEEWEKLLIYSSRNEVLSKEPEDMSMIFWSDGAISKKALFSAWKLFEKLDVTDRNASILAQLGRILYRREPDNFNVINVIKRWAREENEPIYGGPYFFCRTYLADLIHPYKKDDFFKVDDSAIRCSFYRRFRCGSIDESKDYYEKDGIGFIQNIFLNSNFFYSRVLREWLSNKCAEIDKEGPGFNTEYSDNFENHQRLYEKSNPEYFRDEDENIPLQLVTDPIKINLIAYDNLKRGIYSLNEKIKILIENNRDDYLEKSRKDSAYKEIYKTLTLVEGLENSVESLHNKFFDLHSKDIPQSEAIEHISNRLNNILLKMDSIKPKPYPLLVSLLVGMALGYFIGAR